MPIPLVVTKRHIGQRVTSLRHPATQTNKDPNCDKILARSNHPDTSETYRRQDDVFGYELKCLLSGVRPVFQTTSQEVAPTIAKTVNQTSLLHIESSLDRLGLFSPTYGQRSQQKSGQITHQSVFINNPMFFRVARRAEIMILVISTSTATKALSW